MELAEIGIWLHDNLTLISIFFMLSTAINAAVVRLKGRKERRAGVERRKQERA